MRYTSRVKKVFVVLVFSFIVFAPLGAFAAGLEGPLVPGSSGPITVACQLMVLANNLIGFGVAFSVIVATIMFAYAGVLYVTAAANPEQVKKAHKVFISVFVGLVIILIAWLIVDIVLSVLTGNGLKIWAQIPCVADPVSSGFPTSIVGGVAGGAPLAGTFTDAEARAELSAAGIGVVSSGNCDNPLQSSCTSLEGIPASSVQRLIDIKNQCGGCNVTVTGGTETGHFSHGPGKPIVDLRFDQATADFVTANHSVLGVSQVCTTAADAKYSYNCGNYMEGAEQLHIEFSR